MTASHSKTIWQFLKGFFLPFLPERLFVSFDSRCCIIDLTGAVGLKCKSIPSQLSWNVNRNAASPSTLAVLLLMLWGIWTPKMKQSSLNCQNAIQKLAMTIFWETLDLSLPLFTVAETSNFSPCVECRSASLSSLYKTLQFFFFSQLTFFWENKVLLCVKRKEAVKVCVHQT